MTKKIFAALAVVTAVLVALLISACGREGTPAVTSTEGSRATDSLTTPEAVTTAEDETPVTLNGWFDYGSALYLRDKFTPGTASSIEIQMAKNEVEGFQYLVTSDGDVSGLRCDVTPLSDGNGNTLTGTVNVVWYTWVNQSDNRHETFMWYPVAMLPLDDEYQGGSFDVAGGTCRTLYVSYGTDKDTVPGTYKGALTLSKNGETLLSGDVTVRVRDVFYDDKTECMTMMGLGYDKEDTNPFMPAGPESAPALGSQQASGTFANPDLLLEYANFLLDNRFCPTALPFENYLLTDNFEALKSFTNNPRMTGVSIESKPFGSPEEVARILSDEYKIAKENGWEDKIYFGLFDEPTAESHMQYMIANAARVNESFPTTHFMDAFGVDIPLDGKNIVERMSEYSTSFCINTIAFDGAFRDSLLKLKSERGDTLFWYVCGSQQSGFTNVLPCTPGTDKRILFWQQYQQNVDGFLYWRVSVWNFSFDVWADDYMNTKFPFPKSSSPPTDDGTLIYWHPVTKKPVTTLGFEAMRDGVEDFQLFKMAERALGREKVLEYVEQITTGVSSFRQYEDGSTELLNKLKNQIFDLLENAS
ncbi:MAG: DUF4091 domain-containing protein [Clostridia bacterium]|nr:DUF4091 domain-containing protein [Clostridia bacterium]